MSTAVLPLSSSSLSIGRYTLSAQVDSAESRDNNMQQVGEEVEGIVMLSLLKQKMETLSESLRSPRSSPKMMSISDEDDSDAMEAGSPHMKRRTGILDSPSKRRRASPEKSWMDMFVLVKRNYAGTKDKSFTRSKDPETIAMQEWLQRQMEHFARGTLSQERIELLRMVGVELPEDHEAQSHSDDSRNSEDEFEEGNDSGSGRESAEPQRILRSRRTPAALIPPALMANNTSPSEPKRATKRIGGKRKANLKRNSLHNWVYNQRRLQYEGNLPIHRKKLLDKIGFDWKWVQQKIDEQAGQPESKEVHTPKMEEEDEMDVPNSKSEELWHTRYRELIEFKQVHGHYEVPRYVE